MKKKPPKVKQHGRLVMYPQVVQWPSCEADIRTPEAISWRQGTWGQDRVERLAKRGLSEMACGNVASYTVDGHWFCRKHAGLILLDLLAEQPDDTP
jgi:hypothetical protein